jgi:hypothetical protein
VRDVLFRDDIAAVEGEWEDLKNLQPLEALGEDIVDAGPRLGRLLKTYRERQFLDPAPRPPPRGTSWAADDADLRLRLAQVRELRDISATDDTPIGNTENGHFSKFSTQIGAAPGWDVMPDGIGMKGGQSIKEGLLALKFLLDKKGESGPLLPKPSAYPRTSNAGWPTYGTSPKDKIALSFVVAGSRDHEELNAILSGAARDAGFLDNAHITLFSRTGPMGKWQDVFTSQGGRMTKTARMKGLAPRRRHVFGVPAAFNIALQAYQQSAKTRLMSLPMFSHPSRQAILDDGTNDLREMSGRARVIADDPSAFDQHVRGIHHRELAEVLYSEWWPEKILANWKFVHGMSVVAPPLDLTYRGFRYDRSPEGGLQTSGIITTTIDDLCINAARVLMCVGAAFGMDAMWAARAYLAYIWRVRIWGDDTLLFVPTGFDYAAYIQKSEELGFPTAGGPEPVFLMTWFDFGRQTYFPLASRVFQNTVGRERGGRSFAIELLGLFMRTWRLDFNPYGRLVWRALTEHHDGLSSLGIKNREDLGRALLLPDIQLELLETLKASPDIVREMIAKAERGGTTVETLLWLRRTYGLEWVSVEKSALMELPATAAFSGDRSALRYGMDGIRYLLTPVKDRTAKPKIFQEAA